MIPSFAVTCSVGNCLYEETDAGGLSQLCPVDFTPAEFWTGDLVTRVACSRRRRAVLAAALYVRVESQSLYSRKEDLLLLESDAGCRARRGLGTLGPSAPPRQDALDRPRPGGTRTRRRGTAAPGASSETRAVRRRGLLRAADLRRRAGW